MIVSKTRPRLGVECTASILPGLGAALLPAAPPPPHVPELFGLHETLELLGLWLQQYTIVCELPGVDIADVCVEVTREAGVLVTFSRASIEDQLWQLGLNKHECLCR